MNYMKKNTSLMIVFQTDLLSCEDIQRLFGTIKIIHLQEFMMMGRNMQKICI